MKRTVLFYSDSPLKPNELPGLEGWDVLATTDIDRATESATERAVSVGLVRYRGGPAEERLLEQLILRTPQTEWICLVNPEALREVAKRRFISEHFYDFHTLPVEAERLQIILGHASGKAELRKLIAEDQRGQSLQEGQYGMVGTSPAMLKLYAQLDKVRRTDAPVLITGESGTGKELVAHAVHSHCERSEGPFVVVNCASLPPHLIQAELFGYEKGAFTGAYQSKAGLLEGAHGGSIFLDEIGDLPMDLQANLLRFLQEKTIQRLGSNRLVRVDVRVLAATHVDLDQAVKQGHFREDLYYRINVLALHLPPLRERGSDIGLLAKIYFQRLLKHTRTSAAGFSQQALDHMAMHAWGGNVRELINRVRRAMVLTDNRLITPEDLELDQPLGQEFKKPLGSLNGARTLAEQELIRLALRRNQNNLSRTAKELGISRTTLYRLLGKTAGSEA